MLCSITKARGYGSRPSPGRRDARAERSQLPRIAERKRAHPSRVLIQDQRPRDRRFGALAAVFAFAEAAVDADRGTFGFFEVHAGGVYQFGGVADFAAQADRKARLRLRVRRYRTAQHLCNREVSGAVGQFDNLLEQPVRRVEGRVHVPQRTGTAEFRKRKRAGGKPLRHVTGVVDAQQEEWNAARVRSLQGGQAMTDLFEAGIETL